MRLGGNAVTTAPPYPVLGPEPVNPARSEPRQAAPEGPLGIRSITAAPQVRGGESERRRGNRREKRELRSFLERMSTLPAVRVCSTKPFGNGVTLRLRAGVAHFGGLQ